MASACPHPPQKGLPRSGLAARGRYEERGTGEQRGTEDRGEEQENEGTRNKSSQVVRTSGADKERPA